MRYATISGVFGPKMHYNVIAGIWEDGFMMRKLGAMALAMALSPLLPTRSLAYSSSARQRIMNQIWHTSRAVDGLSGGQNIQGLCIFRYIGGLTISRNNLSTARHNSRQSYDSKYSSLKQPAISAVATKRKSWSPHETYQAMTCSVANSGGRHYYKRRSRPGIKGLPPRRTLPLVAPKGWWCSSLYLEYKRQPNAPTDGSVTRQPRQQTRRLGPR